MWCCFRKTTKSNLSKSSLNFDEFEWATFIATVKAVNYKLDKPGYGNKTK